MNTTVLVQSRRLRIYYWCCLFVANLPVPLCFVALELYGDAWFGMYLGIVLTWIMGLPVCYFSPLLGTSLRWGMSFLALSQLCPIIHMFVAEFAFMYASQYKSWPQQLSTPLDTFLSGLVLSLVFGGIWLLTGLIAGAMILGLSVFHDRITKFPGNAQ